MRLPPSAGEPQPGLLQDAGADTARRGARRRAPSRRGDLADLGLDLLARPAVDHGEQIVGPERRVARPAVAVGDEGRARRPWARARRPGVVRRPTRSCRWRVSRARSGSARRRCGGSTPASSIRCRRAITSSAARPSRRRPHGRAARRTAGRPASPGRSRGRWRRWGHRSCRRASARRRTRRSFGRLRTARPVAASIRAIDVGDAARASRSRARTTC